MSKRRQKIAVRNKLQLVLTKFVGLANSSIIDKLGATVADIKYQPVKSVDKIDINFIVE